MSYQYTPKDISRFYSYVKIMPSDCHEWQGVCNSQGYGQFCIDGKMMLWHRVAWEIVNGPILDGLLCLHRCDNPLCCNPVHLWLGTQGDNMRDCVGKGRANRPKGEDHPMAKLTEEDVAEIREAYAGGGCTQRQLAHRFRVTQGVIGPIVRREAWKHVV